MTNEAEPDTVAALIQQAKIARLHAAARQGWDPNGPDRPTLGVPPTADHIFREQAHRIRTELARTMAQDGPTPSNHASEHK